MCGIDAYQYLSYLVLCWCVEYSTVKGGHLKMAGRSLSLEVEIAGVISTTVRAELVKELVKFILYQRNQIPMYFDQLTDLLARESQPPVKSVQ